jgi:hypothetical protein
VKTGAKVVLFWLATIGVVQTALFAAREGAPLVDRHLTHILIAAPVAILTFAVALGASRELADEKARSLAINLVALSSLVPGVLLSVLVLDFHGWDEIWEFAVDLGANGGKFLNAIAIVIFFGIGTAFAVSLALPFAVANWWVGHASASAARPGPSVRVACSKCGRVPRNPDRPACSKCGHPLRRAPAV